MYEKGRRHFSGNFTAFYMNRPGESMPGAGPVRIGFTVGKALGGSVERNRMRRRLREAIRREMHRLAGLGEPVDIVINPKKSVLQVEFAVLSEEVSRCLQTIRQKLEKTDSSKAAQR